MANSPDNLGVSQGELARGPTAGREPLRLGRWLPGYALYLLALLGLAIWLLHGQSADLSPLVPHSIHGLGAYVKKLPESIQHVMSEAPISLKLAILALYMLYMSLSMTFFPLNTGAMVAALSMSDVGLTGSIWTTTALVALIGAVGSTMANITDYGIIHLVAKHPRIAKARQSRLYQRAEQWFARQAFELLLLFSVLPIPIDVARLLAAMHGYSITRFALANLLGRTIRYAVIAAVTYELGAKGWIAPVALLGAAGLMALAKGVGHLVSKATGTEEKSA